MSVTVGECDGFGVLTVCGWVDEYTVGPLRDAVDGVLKVARRAGVLVVGERVMSFDASALGALMRLERSVRGRGGALVVLDAVRGPLARALDSFGATSVPVVGSRAEGLELLEQRCARRVDGGVGGQCGASVQASAVVLAAGVPEGGCGLAVAVCDLESAGATAYRTVLGAPLPGAGE